MQHTAPPAATLAQPPVKDVESNASKTRAPAALGDTQLKAQPIPLSPTTMTGSQKFIAGLAGIGGKFLGFSVGGLTGLGLQPGACTIHSATCGDSKIPIGSLLGSLVGLSAGQAFGVYAYGQSAGLEGSYWQTQAWTTAAHVTLLSSAYFIPNDATAFNVVNVGLIGSLFGSVWAYESSLESTSSTSTVSQTQSKGLNFGVPTVSFDHHNGDRRFTLNLTGGQF